VNSVVKKDEDEEDELQQLPFFRPVYTHQIFDNECIPGWRPTLQAEEQSRNIYQSWRRRNNGVDDNGNNNGIAGEYDGGGDEEHQLHSSYQHCRHCDDDDKQQHTRIDIHILLSPSCENCQIVIQTETSHSASAKENENHEPFKKRIKVVLFAKEVQEVELNTTTTTTTERKKQMDIKDIVQRISLSVPPIVLLRVNGTLKNDWVPSVTAEEDVDKPGIGIAGGVESFAKKKEEGSVVGGSAAAAGGYLSEPIGQILKTYQRKVRGAESSNNKCNVDVDSSTSEFVIALADGSGSLDHPPSSTVARYHNSVQRLARWYIETADGVDVAEDGRGCWKVMYLFRRHNHYHGDDDGAVVVVV